MYACTDALALPVTLCFSVYAPYRELTANSCLVSSYGEDRVVKIAGTKLPTHTQQYLSLYFMFTCTHSTVDAERHWFLLKYT